MSRRKQNVTQNTNKKNKKAVPKLTHAHTKTKLCLCVPPNTHKEPGTQSPQPPKPAAGPSVRRRSIFSCTRRTSSFSCCTTALGGWAFAKTMMGRLPASSWGGRGRVFLGIHLADGHPGSNKWHCPHSQNLEENTNQITNQTQKNAN